MIQDLFSLKSENEKEQQIKISEAIALFITHRREVKKRRPKTLAKYKAATDAFSRYCERQGLRYLQEVNLAALEEFQVYRGTEEKCAAATVIHDVIAIKCLFNFICHPARKLMADNPAAAWEVEKPRMERRHCFTWEEVRMLQDGVRPWLNPIVTTLAYTGMRIEELVQLRWQDLELDEGMLRITARDDWKPKNGESRSVPIHPEVKAVLLRLKLGRRGLYVFRSSRGKQLNQNHIREAFNVDKKKLGIDKGTPHSFRHFFVSLCSNNNVPERVCMTWVGHKDSEMVRCYYHLNDPESKRAMAKLAKQTNRNFDLAEFGGMSRNDTIDVAKETA